MLVASYELGSATSDIEACERDLRLPYEMCSQLYQQAGGDPNLYYAFARAVAIKLGTKACSAAVQAETGTPPPIADKGCNWAITQLVEALEATVSWKGPEWRSFYAGAPDEGVFWRKSESPTPGPGQNWLPPHGGTPARLEFNVAVLDKKGEPRKIVYIPCERLDEGGQVRGHTRCRDWDGVMRPVGTKPPLYRTGFYGNRIEGWPSDLETHPWNPTSLRDRLMANRPEFTTETADVARIYPSGSVTAYDEKQKLWRIAAPRSGLSGEAQWVEIATSPTKPADVAVLPFRDYLKNVGELPWYQDWRVWAVAGGVVAVGGGLLVWKRRKRRKRR